MIVKVAVGDLMRMRLSGTWRLQFPVVENTGLPYTVGTVSSNCALNFAQNLHFGQKTSKIPNPQTDANP